MCVVQPRQGARVIAIMRLFIIVHVMATVIIRRFIWSLVVQPLARLVGVIARVFQLLFLPVGLLAQLLVPKVQVIYVFVKVMAISVAV